MKRETPNKIGCACPHQNDPQHREPLPQGWRAMLERERLDAPAGGQSVSEAGTHDAGQGCDAQPFLQIEFLDGGLLLLRRHGTFFGDSRKSGCRYANEANEDAEQDYLSGLRTENLSHEHPTENRGHESTKGGAQA